MYIMINCSWLAIWLRLDVTSWWSRHVRSGGILNGRAGYIANTLQALRACLNDFTTGDPRRVESPGSQPSAAFQHAERRDPGVSRTSNSNCSSLRRSLEGKLGGLFTASFSRIRNAEAPVPLTSFKAGVSSCHLF